MIRVRAAVVADAHAIANTHVRAWQAGYRGIIADELLDALSADERETSWRALLAGGSGRILVVDADEGPVAGFAGFLLPARDHDAASDTGEVAAIYVDPDHWRRGIASAMLHEALARLEGDGAREVIAWVLEGNAGGHAFWMAAGFERDGATAPHEPYGRVARYRSRLSTR